MSQESLELFCRDWLASWTGNHPERLLQFYTSEAFYRDPAFPAGLVGQDALRQYFTKLLAANPHWRWEAVRVLPTETGCVLKWKATIPVGVEIVEETGLDIVELSGEKISRNEVYFDRVGLLAAYAALKDEE